MQTSTRDAFKGIIIGCLLSGAIVAFTGGITATAAAHQQPHCKATPTSIQTVVVTGNKMTASEKLAYDLEVIYPPAQIVIVSGKRWTPEQKFAYDHEIEVKRQARTHYNKVLQGTV